MAEPPPNLFCSLQSGQPTSSITNPDALGPTCSNSFSMYPRRKKRFTLFRFVKYILILSNAFTGMIGIFIVLFGFAYPDEKFPGKLWNQLAMTTIWKIKNRLSSINFFFQVIWRAEVVRFCPSSTLAGQWSDTVALITKSFPFFSSTQLWSSCTCLPTSSCLEHLHPSFSG